MRILEFLRNNDEFGQEVNFNIANKKRYQTAIGGCCYLSICIIFIFGVLYGFKEYVNKSNPNVFISESPNEEPLVFEKNKVIFGLSGTDHTIKYGGFNNKTYDIYEYFDIIATQITLRENNSPHQKELQIKNCNKFFKNINKNKYCISVPENENIKIQGDSSDKISYILVKLRFCDPTKNRTNYSFTNSTCKGQKAFFDFLNKTNNDNFIGISFNNKIYDPLNYNQPLKPSEKLISIPNSKNILNTLFVNLKKIEVFSDLAGFFNVVDIEPHMEFDSILNSNVYTENYTNKTDYLRIIIKSLEVKKIYKRIYPFIGEWIGDASLVSTWITGFITFFYSFYNGYKFKWFIIKRIVNDENDYRGMQRNSCRLNINNILKGKGERLIDLEYKLEEKICNNDNNYFDDYNENYNGDDNNKSDIKFFSNQNEVENQQNKIEEKIKKEIELIDIDRNKDKIIEDEDIDNKEKENNDIDINDNDNDKDNDIDQQKEISEKDNPLNFISPLKSNISDVSNNLFKKLISKNLKKKGKDINYWTYILSILNIKKKNLFNIFDKVYQHFEKKFDVFYHLKKMKSVKLLKNLLLEENTEKLFDLVSKNLYRLKPENKNKKKINTTEEFLEIIKSIDDTNELNKKLILELFN